MARTWSLTDTLELGRSPIPPFSLYTPTAITRVIENGDHSAVFFNAGTNLVSSKIFQWDGTTILDIAGDFFSNQTGTFGGYGEVVGLSWFQDSLYAAYNIGVYPASGGNVARWNGTTGTSDWTDVYITTDEDPSAGIYQLFGWGLGSAWGNKSLCLDTDGTRLATVFYGALKNRMATSGDGDNWSLQTIGGSYSDPPPYLVGREQGTSYKSLLCLENYPPPGLGNCLVVQPEGGNVWSELTASTTGTNSVLVGYGDSRSFFMVDQGTGQFWELESSDDWGVTFTNANGPSITPTGWASGFPPETIFKRFNNTDILWSERGGTQVYAWNSGSLEIDTDGTTGHAIFGFFRLNGTLYALCGLGGSGKAYMYSAGAIADDVAEFYQGAAGLDFKVNLSFPGVAPGGMAVKDKLDTVVFGSDQGHKEMVDYSLYPYGAILDMDNGMATGAAISTMGWL